MNILPSSRSEATSSLCECRRLSGGTLVIEGNGHTYSCSENPRNMPLWRVECIGCGLPFATPIPADWPEGEYVCEACDG